MVRLILSGCNGHMGRAVANLCDADPELEVAAGIDVLGQPGGQFPVYSSPAACPLSGDVLVDFSHPSALDALLEFCLERSMPAVLATTGYSEQQLEQIGRAAGRIPVFRSANFSLGVNLLMDLVRRAAAALGEGYDVEIVECHHRRKVDAPSGTALMLADAAAQALPYQPDYIYDRHCVRQARQPREIGISSVRGGTIVGDHTVIFAGPDEVIELSHHAASREIFAAGAVRAAKFLARTDRPGLYDMSSLL